MARPVSASGELFITGLPPGQKISGIHIYRPFSGCEAKKAVSHTFASPESPGTDVLFSADKTKISPDYTLTFTIQRPSEKAEYRIEDSEGNVFGPAEPSAAGSLFIKLVPTKTTNYRLLARHTQTDCELQIPASIRVTVIEGILPDQAEAVRKILAKTDNPDSLGAEDVSEVFAGKVTKLDLRNLEAENEIPAELFGPLDELKKVDISENYLGFDELIKLNEQAVNQGFTLVYSPQKYEDTYENATRITNDTLTIRLAEKPADKDKISYRWYGPQGLISEASGPVLSLKKVQTNPHAGKYYALLRHRALPGLQIRKNTVKLSVIDSLSISDLAQLGAFYTSFEGENWEIKWDFTDKNYYKWHGISIRNGRCVGVSLSGNRLKGRLGPHCFGRGTFFDSLETLVLSKNQISGKTEPLSDRLKKLQTLDLSYNRLSELDEDIGEFTGLQTLLLSACPLKKLPESIGKLRRLRTLFVNACGLEKLPESIDNLLNLSTLRIGKNKLKRFGFKLEKLRNLRFLEISRNPFEEWPDDFSQLQKLSTFRASFCGLRQIPPGLEKCRNLSILDVSANRLQFPDLVNWTSDGGHYSGEIIYEPQANFGNPQSFEAALGQRAVLSVAHEEETGNTYRWFKAGTTIGKNVRSNFKNMTIYNLNRENAGNYYLEIQNQKVPGLLLRSVPMNLTAVCGNGEIPVEIDGSLDYCLGETVFTGFSLSRPADYSDFRWFVGNVPLHSGPDFRAERPGTYRLEAKDSKGCKLSSKKLVIRILKENVPQIYAESNRLKIRNFSDFREIRWYKVQGNEARLIGTETEDIFVRSAGEYYVEAVNTGNCRLRSGAVMIRQTGIEEADMTERLSVYPNPVFRGFCIRAQSRLCRLFHPDQCERAGRLSRIF